MIRICDKSVSCPLRLIFQALFQEEIFPDSWKKANIVPVHKKESKNLLKIIGQLAFFQFLRKFSSN